MPVSRRRVHALWLAIAVLLGAATATATTTGPTATTAAPAATEPAASGTAAITGIANTLEEEPAPAAAAEAPEPAAEAPVAAEEPPAPPTVAQRCRQALSAVAAGGLPLPAGTEYRCPSTQFAHHGTACWDWGPCAGGGFIAINMDMLAGASEAYLRHVVAHEVCHIIDFRRKGTTTEWGADACAAAYGF